MNTRKYILSVLILLAFYPVKSQDCLGVWYSGYDKEQLITKRDSIQIDTFYYRNNVLLDFLDSKNVIIKRIGKNEEKGKYKVYRKRIKIKFEHYKLKGRISDNKIGFKLNYLKNRKRDIVFEKISMSTLSTDSGIDSLSMINTNWVTLTDSSSCKFGFDYHFLDSSLVIKNKDYGGYGNTSLGEYKVDQYKNHFFISIKDFDELETIVYHLKAGSNSSFIAESYDLCGFPGTTSPELNSLGFNQTNLLNTNQLIEKEKEIIGKWTALNTPFSSSTIEKDGQMYEITFQEDKEYHIKKTANFIVKDSIKTLQETTSGKWKLGETGKYIELSPYDNWMRHLTIYKLEKNQLIIFSDERFRKRFSFNTTIKLTK